MLADLQDLLPKFARRAADDPETYPAADVADLHAAGVLLAPFPAALGGEGASLVEAVRAVEVMAAAAGSTALIASMPLGLAGALASAGTAVPDTHRAAYESQLARVAADYRAGQLYAACNSERGAGGSLAATKTAITRNADGGLRISGEKILASSGRHADVFFSTAKVQPADLPGAGDVEFFFVPVADKGVHVLSDWDGFGMRSTESQSVRFEDAAVREVAGFPGFIDTAKPLQYFFCLFAAVPLGCARAVLESVANPWPESPALRMRLEEAQMRYEALRAYLLDTAARWQAGAPPAFAARVLRTKTYVSQESTKLAAELFALGGGSRYRRHGVAARALADSFAGTALRPPLSLAIETLAQAEQLSLEP